MTDYDDMVIVLLFCRWVDGYVGVWTAERDRPERGGMERSELDIMVVVE